MPGAAERDQTIQHCSRPRGPVLVAGVEPPLEDPHHHRHLLPHALMGAVDAQPALVEGCRALERCHAVVRERPAQPFDEPPGQLAALRIESAQVGEDVLLGAQPFLPFGVVVDARFEESVDVGEEREQLVLCAAERGVVSAI